MWSTSLTAPIHLDKSPAIASKSRPAWKAFLIPLKAAVAVDIAALTVNGSIMHLYISFGKSYIGAVPVDFPSLSTGVSNNFLKADKSEQALILSSIVFDDVLTAVL